MASSNISTLLIDAPVGRHFAQLHSEKADLVASVGMFLKTGILRGQGVVLIASRGATDDYLSYVDREGIDIEKSRRSGQFVVKNAEDTLAGFMVADMPDWARFRRLVGSILEEVQAFGRSTTRAYGEMVNVLWREGKPLAAVRLEEYWNELARLYPFSLFCGYMLDSHDDATYQQPLAEIGRTHSHIIPTTQDRRFQDALDRASRDVYGTPLSQLLARARHEDNAGELRLPVGQRTMLWIMRHMPETSAEVLERARRYYRPNP
jgi:hypothetical protein